MYEKAILGFIKRQFGALFIKYQFRGWGGGGSVSGDSIAIVGSASGRYYRHCGICFGLSTWLVANLRQEAHSVAGLFLGSRRGSRALRRLLLDTFVLVGAFAALGLACLHVLN